MSVLFIEKDNLNKFIKKRVKPANVILDIGCGINPQRIIKPKIHICVEPYSEYVKKLMEKTQFENFVYLTMSAVEAVMKFPDKSIDSIFMIDLIEHIDQESGVILLSQCERVAKKQIIVFTPLGFFPQEYIKDRKDLWGMDGGFFQEHKSGWELQDFDDSWDLLCVKEFHFDDGYGNKFEKPYGAIFAIKSFKDNSPKRTLAKRLIKNFVPSPIERIFVKFSNKLKKIFFS